MTPITIMTLLISDMCTAFFDDAHQPSRPQASMAYDVYLITNFDGDAA